MEICSVFSPQLVCLLVMVWPLLVIYALIFYGNRSAANNTAAFLPDQFSSGESDAETVYETEEESDESEAETDEESVVSYSEFVPPVMCSPELLEVYPKPLGPPPPSETASLSDSSDDDMPELERVDETDGIVYRTGVDKKTQ